MYRKILSLAFLALGMGIFFAQQETETEYYVDTKSSETTIVTTHNEDEDDGKPLKLHHAEPLYIDLIRDLGARKGEKEWNIGGGFTEKDGYYQFTPFIEYEWAVMDRVGLEVELPFSVYTVSGKQPTKSPGTRLEGIKTAIQYTFLVNKKNYVSMAVGYLNELELNSFRNYGGKNIFFTGNVYNPFFVAAKGWGKNHNFNTLIYAGPQFIQHFHGNHWETDWVVNTNFHYVIPGTKNFIGLEIDKNISSKIFNMVLRPQMRVALKDNLILGMVVGIPTNRQREGFSGFTRLIWEPAGKKSK